MGLEQPREEEMEEEERGMDSCERRSPDSPPVQLELLPFSPVPRRNNTATGTSSQASQRALVLSSQLGLQWTHEHAVGDRSSGGAALALVELADGISQPAASSSPPNSTAASFHLDFSSFETATGDRAEKATSRASDEDENSGGARKKLRLSKEQSAFLEESFKEHSTLNPKHALAKQLSLRPRQVEVWFQNRRARTKLKQTEVDCEHLKRCCERLTEENRRLQRELQELRALKATAAAHPFYGGQLTATTLSMCPSCERVAAAAANASPSPSPATGSAMGNLNIQMHQDSDSPVPVGLNPNCLASAGKPEKS